MSNLMRRLAGIRDRGDIAEISYQLCEFIKRQEPDCSDSVLIAACLAAQRGEEGDVCVQLSNEANKKLFAGEEEPGVPTPPLEDWVNHLEASKCVGTTGEGRPLVLDDAGRLYLHKFWKYEVRLARQLLARAAKDPEMAQHPDLVEELNKLFDAEPAETDWQKVAAWTALRQKLAVISGGPGTGKTTTVVKILLLMARLGSLQHVALAAPTGKAASRLMESVGNTLERFNPEEQIRRQLPDQAVTIHRLLGARRHGSSFRYNRDNPLPFDLVIVDEASMVDLALMVKLVEALPQNAKLILLGDKDQLASVEAGAVLGSICALNENRFSREFITDAADAGLKIPESACQPDPDHLTDHIVLLQKSYRFGSQSGIGTLAKAILQGEGERAVDILQSEDFKDVSLQSFSDSPGLHDILLKLVIPNFQDLVQHDDIEAVLSAISEVGILCVHRRGPLGAEHINRLVEQLLRKTQRIPATAEWYAGKPVMATRNDYSLGLRNGELGITRRDGEGNLKVYFREAEGTYRSFYPSRLSQVETAFAVTVHKSQGSEFNRVGIVLPNSVSPVCSRELLYTAITRARNACTVIGKTGVFQETVSRKIDRSSGLIDRLWSEK